MTATNATGSNDKGMQAGASQEPTAGPWTVVENRSGGFDLLGDGGSRLLLSNARLINQPANCRLIASAPDLLAALRIAVRQNSHDMLMTGEELRLCEAALLRASGGTAP
jgi:hypothetical protein